MQNTPKHVFTDKSFQLSDIKNSGAMLKHIFENGSKN